MNFLKNKKNKKRGIALFIAVIVSSAILLITLSIADIAFKEQIISYSGRDSKVAFYAADAGLECALYHDVKKADFAFAKNSTNPQVGAIRCISETGDPVFTTVTPSATAATTFFFFNPVISQWSSKSCAIVFVEKTLVGAGPEIHTKISAYGYNNTCDTNGTVVYAPRNLERALEVNY